jgi:hypothetical protein
MNENVSNLESFLKRIKLEIHFEWADFEYALENFYFNDINDNKDKICLLIHLIMIQQSFNTIIEENTYRGINQSKSEFYNKITYNSINFKDNYIKLTSNILITVLKSGNTVDIHLKYKTYNTKFLTLKLNEFFQTSSLTEEIREKMLIKFQIDFKDIILNPFKHYLRSNEDGNISLINGLIDLPLEIIFKICTNYLSVKSIVSLASTCNYLNKILFSNLTKSETIWNKLIYRDFKIKLTINDATLTNTNYLQEYKKYHRKRKSNYNILII